jgi:hypothetical protein
MDDVEDLLALPRLEMSQLVVRNPLFEARFPLWLLMLRWWQVSSGRCGGSACTSMVGGETTNSRRLCENGKYIAGGNHRSHSIAETPYR